MTRLAKSDTFPIGEVNTHLNNWSRRTGYGVDWIMHSDLSMTLTFAGSLGEVAQDVLEGRENPRLVTYKFETAVTFDDPGSWYDIQRTLDRWLEAGETAIKDAESNLEEEIIKEG